MNSEFCPTPVSQLPHPALTFLNKPTSPLPLQRSPLPFLACAVCDLPSHLAPHRPPAAAISSGFASYSAKKKRPKASFSKNFVDIEFLKKIYQCICWIFFVMGVENATIMNDSEGHLPREAKKVLYSLASAWDDVVDTNALNVVPLKGAMTNAVFAVDWSTEKGKLPRKVLLRIYGEGVDVFFDREDEIRTFECMSKHGQGPHLLGRFKNGRVEEFINARTLSASDLRDPEISALVATKLKEFHFLDMPGSKDVILWDRLRSWCAETKLKCSADEAKEFRLDAIEVEISLLEKELSRENQSIGFCHNDLQYGNLMIDKDGVTIIDYEYAGYNPVPFDLANHFCEMAADYHSEMPHILDYDKYPDLEERQRFARAYLSSPDNEPSDAEVQQLVEDAEKYTLASHLLWGLWGIISEKVNEIDYNYIEYAQQRFRQYWSTRSKLLNISEHVKDDGCAVVS